MNVEREVNRSIATHDRARVRTNSPKKRRELTHEHLFGSTNGIDTHTESLGAIETIEIDNEERPIDELRLEARGEMRNAFEIRRRRWRRW